ncbi:MAG: hypothetical protein NTX74_09135 [Flavobacterium sp.]|jgi:Kef-type K+ transport system membrane component KefB|nr:hypothetical protein [Flavobacterium sp.]
MLKKLLLISNMQLLVLFIIGMGLTMSGAFMKLQGSPEASLFLVVGMTFDAVTFILLVIKRFQKNNKSFLDS